MSKFCFSSEFKKELKKLSSKFPSLESDLEDLKPILLQEPTGIGKNFTIILSSKEVKVVKVRVHCESLRARTIRLIYSYEEEKIEFLFIEIYHKGRKENEDRERIKQYLKNMK